MLWVSGERGQAMILALLIVGVGLVVTVALATMGTGAIKISRAHAEDVKALYIAEAGLEQALAQLRFQPSWSGFKDESGTDLWIDYGEGQFRIELDPNAFTGWNTQERTVTVTSTGRHLVAGETIAQKTLVASVVVRLHDALWGWPGLFVDGTAGIVIGGSTSLEITDDAGVLSGTVYVRGDLTISGNGRLTADILAVERELYVQKENRLSANEVRAKTILDYTMSKISLRVPVIIRNWDIQDKPDLVFTADMREYYQELAADPSIAVWNQDSLLDMSGVYQLDGLYRCNGPLDLKSGIYSGRGTIIATGDVRFASGKTLEKADDESCLTIITPTGQVTLGGGEILGANVVAHQLRLNGNASILGIAMVEDVSLNGGGNSVNFDLDNLFAEGGDLALPGTSVKISSWREKHGVF
ncbi:MAG: pilus assembly PilX N-terminal domain-containing protein [Eubacteriales bacterium]|nr:pilus assembly PilX N-terminal domain-containing protein [Bacillota bacterium]MBV1726652.1 pilus assembly PilX N-terminal domain-containing protein [Desulforudis sp.]MBV1735141.1 pilus assembly PilX N-terminal domain-containing protein [Desulforudis sp.]MDZ4042477.1 pilus assembly PilX N-terminal domain-containing protein [Eubacteriales bacterium]MDZ7610585.1 pilus assembly PilX N-terminal domain-containing protein [Eubacteriales bacterium]